MRPSRTKGRPCLFSTASASSTEPFSILVVDDDLAVCRLLVHLLETSGYRVSSAHSIAEARAMLKSGSWDLFLLDRILPDGDGIQLSRELKHDGRGLSRYVLMLTGESSEAAKVEGFDGGADDYVIKPFQIPELLARVRAGLRIVELQKALIASNRRLEMISATDPLTGVRNRRWFDEEFQRAFAHAIRYQRPLSLAVVDIDYFKNVNDHFGHLSGDAVLQQIATILSGILRQSDALARIGGEEFAVLLPETALFEGLQFAEKIRHAVEESVLDIGEQEIHATISIGLASIPHSHLGSTEEMLRFADKALYRAKNRGRNRIEIERRTDPWRRSRTAASALAVAAAE